MTIKSHKHTCLIFLVTFLFITSLQSQQTNFIHIQSEANQPFAVQLKGQIYSSSVSGYLVIPQVPVGDHTLIVGFAGNNFPEYSFQCSIADKPRGFSLKQGVDNSWTLFDMVDFTVIRGSIPIKETAKIPEIKVQEPDVVKKTDSVLVAIPKQNAEPKANPIVTPSSNSNTSTISNATSGVANTAVTAGVLAATAATGVVVSKSKPMAKQSSIQKIFDKSSNSGIDQVYIVVNNGKADTIALFIPVLKEEQNKQGSRIQKSLSKPGNVESIVIVTDRLFTKSYSLLRNTK